MSANLAELSKTITSLKENERLFGIRVEALLTVVGEPRRPEEVYRKVAAVRLAALR